MAAARQQTRVLEEEARDSMAAALLARSSAIALEDVPGKRRNLVLERVRFLNYLDLVRAKMAELIKTIEANTDVQIARMTGLFGSALPEHHNTARNEVVDFKTAAVTGLEKFRGYVQEVNGRVAVMSTCVELDGARKMVDDHQKLIMKSEVGAHTRLLRAFTKLLTQCERENQLLGAAATEGEEAPDVAPPLYTILMAIISDGEINGDGSLFEAKQGHKPALLVPTARPIRVGMGKWGVEMLNRNKLYCCFCLERVVSLYKRGHDRPHAGLGAAAPHEVGLEEGR
jgi:hypothetical protein